MSIALAAVDSVSPAPPTVLAVTSLPVLTLTASISIVLEPVPSCVTTKVNVVTPVAGTFVKCKSSTLVAIVKVPVLPSAKSIARSVADVITCDVSL